MKQESLNFLNFSRVLAHRFWRCWDSEPIFLKNFHEIVRYEPAKSYNRPSANERCLRAFYGRQNRNQAIFSVLTPTNFGGTEAQSSFFSENFTKPSVMSLLRVLVGPMRLNGTLEWDP